MKVEGSDKAAPARPAADKGRFQQALQQAGREQAQRTAVAAQGQVLRRPLELLGRQGLHVSARVATGQVAYASSEHLGQVRRQLHTEAHRLGEVRTESQQQSQERTTQRLTELIARELSRELQAEPTLPPSPQGQAADKPPPPAATELPVSSGELQAQAAAPAATSTQNPPDPEARIQATLELIERIDYFVRSQRPGLSLELGGALKATVEVERTGAREVSLRIQGHHGPLSSEDLALLREALQARGLKLSALHSS